MLKECQAPVRYWRCGCVWWNPAQRPHLAVAIRLPVERYRDHRQPRGVCRADEQGAPHEINHDDIGLLGLDHRYERAIDVRLHCGNRLVKEWPTERWMYCTVAKGDELMRRPDRSGVCDVLLADRLRSGRAHSQR